MGKNIVCLSYAQNCIFVIDEKLVFVSLINILWISVDALKAISKIPSCELYRIKVSYQSMVKITCVTKARLQLFCVRKMQ